MVIIRSLLTESTNNDDYPFNDTLTANIENTKITETLVYSQIRSVTNLRLH